MAGYSYNEAELHDDVRRLLPPEILEDIGVIARASEPRSLDIVDELAGRLAAVLGGRRRASQRRTTLPALKVADATFQHYQQLEVRMQAKRAEARMLPENGCRNLLPGWTAPPGPGSIMPLLVAAVPPVPAARRGTGVFLPRAVASACVYRHHTTTPSSGHGDGDYDGCFRQRCQKGARSRKQQQLRLHHSHARVVAAEMLGEHLRNKNSSVVASHAPILPQEWVY